VEGRPLTEENTGQSNQRRTPSRESGPSGLERVRKAAKKKGGKARFTVLLHHVSVDQLRDSYHSLKKKAAPGVDGVTWQEYGEGLEARLSGVHGRIHSGAYRAQPSRRTWIPKGDGRQRPLGMAADGTQPRSGKRTFWVSRTGSGQGEASTLRWMRYGSGL